MATLTELREGLADTLTDGGLRTHAYIPSSLIDPPVAVVRPTRGEPVTMGYGHFTAQFDLVVLSSIAADTIHGQRVLDSMLSTYGDRSPYRIVAADRTLGLTNTNCVLAEWTNYGTFTFGDVEYFGAAIECRIVTQGTS